MSVRGTRAGTAFTDRLPWLLSSAVTLLVLTHLLAAHVSHAIPLAGVSDHHGSAPSAFETRLRHDSRVDPGSIVTGTGDVCPIPRMLIQRLEYEIEFGPGNGGDRAAVLTTEPASQAASIAAPLLRPSGPERQAILQRFTL